MLTIQILQYEFLGPIKLDEWGPPMEKVVYIILSRTDDKFNIIYAGDCEKTEEKNFFVNNSNFKCCIKTAGSENSLYLAILPMFDSDTPTRKNIVSKILLRYNPSCNESIPVKETPDYMIRPKKDPSTTLDNDSSSLGKVSCPCCGSEMKIDKILANTKFLKCTGCGLSDTRVNS